jgi:hypothetical protein
MKALIFVSLLCCPFLACGPSVGDIPSCEGVDTSDLTCENAKQKYEAAESGDEQECYQDYWSACAEAGMVTDQ